MLTRKYYKQFAEAIADEIYDYEIDELKELDNEEAKNYIRHMMVDRLLCIFKKDNPRFNESRFINATGVYG